MKDKVINYWHTSSYLRRSVIIYTAFSIMAIISKLLNDGLGFLSSMIVMGFLLAIVAVVTSVVYALVMGVKGQNAIKESFLAIFVLILFLFLISLISSPKKIVEEKNITDAVTHSVIEAPAVKNP